LIEFGVPRPEWFISSALNTAKKEESAAGMDELLAAVKFNDQGLVCAVVQDAHTREVLMVAWMNREALRLTLAERRAWYYSRSRSKLWLKGESSGHTQKVRSVRLDCDGDAILLEVEQAGGACHTGYQSCFYRRADADAWVEDGVKVFDPEKVYRG
jgi:phosphoribosyl-AMP cyclohydrolase